MPISYWTQGYDQKIDLPGLAMLLAIAAEREWREFTAEYMSDWYGWSADTTVRGIKKLKELDLIDERTRYRRAPLSGLNATPVKQYRLKSSMRPAARPRPEGDTTP